MSWSYTLNTQQQTSAWACIVFKIVAYLPTELDIGFEAQLKCTDWKWWFAMQTSRQDLILKSKNTIIILRISIVLPSLFQDVNNHGSRQLHRFSSFPAIIISSRCLFGFKTLVLSTHCWNHLQNPLFSGCYYLPCVMSVLNPLSCLIS